MAKKQKSGQRAPRSTSPLRYSQAGSLPNASETVAKSAPSTSARTTRAAAPPARVLTAEEYQREYAYVFSDLRRVTLTAGLLLALIVGLSFVLR